MGLTGKLLISQELNDWMNGLPETRRAYWEGRYDGWHTPDAKARRFLRLLCALDGRGLDWDHHMWDGLEKVE